MEPLQITLPWPPSVNQYWRHVVVRRSVQVRISAEGRAYRDRVAACVLKRRPLPRLAGRLQVRIDAYPPDARVRDLDNLPKAILDALTHSGVWDDDGQIDDLHIVRGDLRRPQGLIVVTVGLMGSGA